MRADFPPPTRPSIVHRARPTSATIGEAVDLVAEGGMVLVSRGVYHEQVVIDRPNITVRGEDRNETVIDGEGRRPFGIVATADGVTDPEPDRALDHVLRRARDGHARRRRLADRSRRATATRRSTPRSSRRFSGS